MTSSYRLAIAGFAFVLLSLPAPAQEKPVENDIPPSFSSPKQTVYEPPKPTFDYIKRVEMVPMRDGVKLGGMSLPTGFSWAMEGRDKRVIASPASARRYVEVIDFP